MVATSDPYCDEFWIKSSAVGVEGQLEGTVLAPGKESAAIVAGVAGVSTRKVVTAIELTKKRDSSSTASSTGTIRLRKDLFLMARV